MLPSFNETKYNSHWQLCSLEELGRGKSKHRPRDDNRLFLGEYPFIQTGDIKATNLWISSYRTSRTRKPTSSDVG